MSKRETATKRLVEYWEDKQVLEHIKKKKVEKSTFIREATMAKVKKESKS